MLDSVDRFLRLGTERIYPGCIYTEQYFGEDLFYSPLIRNRLYRIRIDSAFLEQLCRGFRKMRGNDFISSKCVNQENYWYMEYSNRETLTDLKDHKKQLIRLIWAPIVWQRDQECKRVRNEMRTSRIRRLLEEIRKNKMEEYIVWVFPNRMFFWNYHNSQEAKIDY